MKTIGMRRKADTSSGTALDQVHNARGFSLIEMFFVIAIILIVLAFAVPSYVNSSRPDRIRNDADSLANLVVMARMRASVEFAHTRLYCNLAPASGPGYCQLQSQSSTASSWSNEQQIVYLSQGNSFGIPASITTYLPNQPGAAYQGDAAQGVTNTPVILFNSRGLPMDAATGTTTLTSDYALYIHDPAGNYYAIAVNLTGRPDLYQWSSATKAFFGPMAE